MSTFHLINFGCRASQADGFALKRQLLDAGLEEAASAEASQVAVLNTCTVTAAADAEVRQIIRRIHRANPACRIVITGCYAQRAPAEIARLKGVACVVGNSHKHALAEILTASPGGRSARTPAAPEARIPAQPAEFVQIQPPPESPAPIWVGEISEEFHFAPVFADDRTRPTLKVQDGCDARCAFCVIPSVRGPSRSLPPAFVLEQARRLVDEGYKEIVLSGINLGRYGRDLSPRTNFLALLERLLAETSVARLRISSIEPMDVSPALVRLAASEPRIAEHFHVPLQSGSDRILRAMNRRYWTRQYAERLLAIREALPNAALGADVMVGFPGETAADHQASTEFIASLPFTYLHVFPFSARPGTAAATRSGQVNGRVAHERSSEIRALAAQKRQAFLARQIGRTLSALTLDEAREGTRLALTTNYLQVFLPGSSLPPNRLLDVQIGRVEQDHLVGFPARHPGQPADEPSEALQTPATAWL